MHGDSATTPSDPSPRSFPDWEAFMISSLTFLSVPWRILVFGRVADKRAGERVKKIDFFTGACMASRGSL